MRNRDWRFVLPSYGNVRSDEMKASQKIEWAIFIILVAVMLLGCTSLVVLTMLE
jgi:hypothetical protein